MVNAKKAELIAELKELRIQKQMTYQQIVDATAAINCPVSLSTVKTVFSDTRSHDHEYNNVLKPIADVLRSPTEADDLETKTLQTRLEYKEEIIKQLQERIARKEEKHQDREAFLREQLDFYKDQIRFKDSQIKRLNESIDRKDALIRKYLVEDE